MSEEDGVTTETFDPNDEEALDASIGELAEEDLTEETTTEEAAAPEVETEVTTEVETEEHPRGNDAQSRIVESRKQLSEERQRSEQLLARNAKLEFALENAWATHPENPDYQARRRAEEATEELPKVDADMSVEDFAAAIEARALARAKAHLREEIERSSYQTQVMSFTDRVRSKFSDFEDGDYARIQHVLQGPPPPGMSHWTEEAAYVAARPDKAARRTAGVTQQRAAVAAAQPGSGGSTTRQPKTRPSGDDLLKKAREQIKRGDEPEAMDLWLTEMLG